MVEPARTLEDMLWDGFCNRGHLLLAPEDIAERKTKLGGIHFQCRHCMQEIEKFRTDRAAYSKGKVPMTREVILECDHILHFEQPVPRSGEILWCHYHVAKKRVVRIGDRVKKVKVSG